VIVLRRDEDETVGARDAGAPVLGVIVDVLGEARMLRLVEHRQRDVLQVDEFDLGAAARGPDLEHPVGDAPADAAFPRACDDDLNERHDVSLF